MAKALRKGNATAVTVNHPPDRHPSYGHDERIAEKQRLALKYRMDGLDREQIALRIQAAMELAEPPPVDTVSRWIHEAHKRQWGEMKELAAESLMMAVEEIKRQIGYFAPMAAGKMHVEKWQMIGGQMVIQIDEEAFKERIKASELVGRHLERLVKFCQAGIETKEEGGIETPGGIRSMQQIIMQENHIHFVMPGQETPAHLQGEPVVIGSGDPAIDAIENGGGEL